MPDQNDARRHGSRWRGRRDQAASGAGRSLQRAIVRPRWAGDFARSAGDSPIRESHDDPSARCEFGIARSISFEVVPWHARDTPTRRTRSRSVCRRCGSPPRDRRRSGGTRPEGVRSARRAAASPAPGPSRPACRRRPNRRVLTGARVTPCRPRRACCCSAVSIADEVREFVRQRVSDRAVDGFRGDVRRGRAACAGCWCTRFRRFDAGGGAACPEAGVRATPCSPTALTARVPGDRSARAGTITSTMLLAQSPIPGTPWRCAADRCEAMAPEPAASTPAMMCCSGVSADPRRRATPSCIGSAIRSCARRHDDSVRSVCVAAITPCCLRASESSDESFTPTHWVAAPMTGESRSRSPGSGPAGRRLATLERTRTEEGGDGRGGGGAESGAEDVEGHAVVGLGDGDDGAVVEDARRW